MFALAFANLIGLIGIYALAASANKLPVSKVRFSFRPPELLSIFNPACVDPLYPLQTIKGLEAAESLPGSPARI